jgi:hypothetical protein
LDDFFLKETDRVPENYRTVFEAGFFSNGEMLKSLGFLAVGLVVIGCMIHKFRMRNSARWDSILFLALWSILWISVSAYWLGSNLYAGWTYTNALGDGKCDVIEGIVEVLHQEPKHGHSGGDRIRVNGREFRYSYFSSTLSYNQTVAHGGVLTPGTKVRLHSLNGKILKVEVRE